MMMKGICAGLSLFFGFALLAMGVLTIFFFDSTVNKFIDDRLVVTNGSEMMDRFVNPPVTPYLEMYFFTITNAEEFLAGQKPIVKEVGPYTYKQVWDKVNVTVHDNGTISSALRKNYFFDRTRSVGSESDNITILNVPMVTAVWQVRFLPRFIQLIFSSMLEVLEVQPFATHNVSEFMWGYEDPLIKMSRDIMPAHLRLPTDSFGFFLNRNNTATTLYNQFTGSEGMSNYMSIDWMNRESSLSLWLTDECNKIHGSDGSGWPPHVQRKDRLFLFNPAMCRALPLTYVKDIERYGIKGYRFSPPKDVFADVSINPENECYCVGGPPCLGGGVFNASICTFGSPVVLSWPHFFEADQKYLDDVDGLHPDPEKHRFFIDLAPRTGTPLVAEGKVQINMALTNVSEIKPANGLRPMIFPVAWFQDGVPKMSPDIVAQLRMATNLPETIKITLLTLLFAFGVVLFVGGVTIFVTLVNRNKDDIVVIRPDGLHGHSNPALEHYPEKD